MSTYVTAASNAGDWFLDQLSTYQELWLKGVSILNAYLVPVTPKVANDYASMTAVVTANFDFLEKLLVQQQKFAEAIYGLGQPGKVTPTGKSPAARSTAGSKKTTRKPRPKVAKAKPGKAPSKRGAP